MFAIAIDPNFPRTYANFGNHAEQALAYTLTGEVRKHDSVPFWKDSDIPEYDMSVKASGFTLASGKLNIGDTFDEKVNDFMARVHSTQFAYVSQEMKAYVMNANEFRSFLYAFCGLDRDSTKNGGRLKIKCRTESKKMRAWLEKNLADSIDNR